MKTTCINFEKSFTIRAGLDVLVNVIAVAAAMVVGAWIKIPLPFTPVPVTLQTFVVLIAPFMVGRNHAASGVALYVLFGALGAPLFATISGATLGYLAAFGAVPFIIGICKKPVVGLVFATLTIWVLGASWLMAWLHCSIGTAFVMGVAPFAVGDVIKATTAYFIIKRIRS